MLFNSSFFIFLFLPLTITIYFLLNKRRLTVPAVFWLVFCSLLYYAWWDAKFLTVLLVSMAINYAIGAMLGKGLITGKFNRGISLAIGVSANIGLLGYFKYTNFLIHNINRMFAYKISGLDLILPLGISFITFQQIAYLVDCYRKDIRDYNFPNYVLFVSFFPKLTAGPIVHYKDIMPRFEAMKNRFIDFNNMSAGLFIFFIGLFKKAIIADTLSGYVTQGFDGLKAPSFVDAWTVSLSYTFQIYFDFSGLMDMAVGTALLLNIKLPANFNSPYKALSIRDFWRRWHITLSNFLRDHIYIPLGGNRKGDAVTYFNLMVTFLIGGLWHGAGWTFVFWGFLHGMAMVINRMWQKTGIRMNKFLSWFITFNFINVSWVFFRAAEWGDAVRVLKGMTGIGGGGFLESSLSEIEVSFIGTLLFGSIINNVHIMLACLFFIVYFMKNSNALTEEFAPGFRNGLMTAFLAFFGIFNLDGVAEFIYWRF